MRSFQSAARFATELGSALRGVARRVEWRAQLRFDAEGMRVQAGRNLRLEAFGIPVPRLPVGLSVDPEVRLEADLYFRRRPAGSGHNESLDL